MFYLKELVIYTRYTKLLLKEKKSKDSHELNNMIKAVTIIYSLLASQTLILD